MTRFWEMNLGDLSLCVSLSLSVCLCLCLSLLNPLTIKPCVLLTATEFKGLVSRVVNMTNTNLDMLGLHKASWGQQFSEAMNVNGGEVESATATDYIMHFFTFGWKVSLDLGLFSVLFCRRRRRRRRSSSSNDVNGRWKLQVGSNEQQRSHSQRLLILFLLFFWIKMVHARGRCYSLWLSLALSHTQSYNDV